MSRTAVVALLLLIPILTACASDGPQRQSLPDRVQPQRPDGLEPDGVADMRSTLADRRSASREMMDTQLIQAEELDTNSGSWFDGLFGLFAWL